MNRGGKRIGTVPRTASLLSGGYLVLREGQTKILCHYDEFIIPVNLIFGTQTPWSALEVLGFRGDALPTGPAARTKLALTPILIVCMIG